MRAIRLILTTVVAGIAVLVPAGAAFAYPDGVLDITVDGSVCSNATVPVGVDTNGTPADFVVSFSGQTKSGSDGASFSTTVKAPEVTETQRVTLSASATSTDGTDQTLNASTVVTVRDCSDDGAAPADDGLLPNTGGANFWLLVAGAGLLLVGGGIVVAQRQRA